LGRNKRTTGDVLPGMATTTVGLGSSSPALSPGPTIELCGRLCIERDGHRVESGLPGRQGRLLFAYLVLNRSRPVSRDELIDAIWWQAQPGAPAAALSALLSRLRRLLGAHWLEGRGELRLALPDDAWVDVEVAREAAALAQAASAEGEYARARGPATLVVQLADRGLLPGLDAPWLDERRRELEELALCSLECIAQAGAPLRGPALAAGESAARRMIERAPYRESGHRRLMEILEARGDVAEALGVYERLRCLLRDELGAAPAPELQAVHERLLHAGDRRSAARRGREGTLGRRLLGRDELHFVGRRSELDLFDGLFVDDPARSVVLIHGPGGIGKSTLLREVARRGARHGWTPRLVEGRELLPVPNALEEALAGVREDERPLLLFDTYERIQAIDSYLRRCLLPALPERAIVVIAGRRPPSVGWSEGGWENLTAELELQRLSPDEAIELLRVHGITNELATQRILAWADGSPLALALAAARGGGPTSIE
jgi:DNA-binding SARP family transcriptional activator